MWWALGKEGGGHAVQFEPVHQGARPWEATYPQTTQLQGPWDPPCPLNQGDWVSLICIQKGPTNTATLRSWSRGAGGRSITSTFS